MSGLEIAGFAVGTVISAADAVIKVYVAFDEHREARGDVLSLYVEIKDRVGRMRTSIDKYFVGVKDESIPGDVLNQAQKEFVEIKKELVALLDQRFAASKFKRQHLPKHVSKLRDSNEKLRDLERQINMLGVTLHEINTLRLQLERMMQVASQQPVYRGDAEISEVVRTI